MRALLIILALSMLGATTPRHRRFQQPNLPHSSCTPARGSAIINTDWADLAAGVAAPTRTLNAGPSPGCDNSLLRLQFTATSGGAQYSSITNTIICPGVAKVSYGLWVQGTSGSGATDVCSFNGTVWSCSTINFTTTPTWFSVQNANFGGSGQLAIGNLSAVNGSIARSTADVKSWGVRCVSGATISQ